MKFGGRVGRSVPRIAAEFHRSLVYRLSDIGD
jgi:hypothetical protein